MTAQRTIPIRGRIVLAILIAQLVAIAISALLLVLLFDPPRGGVLRGVAIVWLISLVATVIAGVIASRILTIEAKGIADGASRYSRGEFVRQVTSPTTTEFTPIAESLNSIALQLRDRVENLQRLESLRSDFAANVSHELRTPITNIKGYIETLLEFGFDDRDEALRYLDIIRTNSSRLGAIVEDIMALSKFESTIDESLEDSTPIQIDELLTDISQQFEREAAAREINVVVEPCEGLAIRGHKQLLEQAISNLVSNAIRYSNQGTAINLRAHTDNGWISIEVADTGPGIESEHLPRLFERFYRVDKARSRAVGGTGLGLAIVKHIAIKHGGNVEAISELGKGSIFRIVLPATPSAQTI